MRAAELEQGDVLIEIKTMNPALYVTGPLDDSRHTIKFMGKTLDIDADVLMARFKFAFRPQDIT